MKFCFNISFCVIIFLCSCNKEPDDNNSGDNSSNLNPSTPTEQKNQSQGNSPSQSQGNNPSQSQGNNPSQSQGNNPSQSQGNNPSQSQGNNPSQSQGNNPSQSKGNNSSQSQGNNPSQSQGSSSIQSQSKEQKEHINRYENLYAKYTNISLSGELDGEISSYFSNGKLKPIKDIVESSLTSKILDEIEIEIELNPLLKRYSNFSEDYKNTTLPKDFQKDESDYFNNNGKLKEISEIDINKLDNKVLDDIEKELLYSKLYYKNQYSVNKFKLTDQDKIFFEEKNNKIKLKLFNRNTLSVHSLSEIKKLSQKLDEIKKYYKKVYELWKKANLLNKNFKKLLKIFGKESLDDLNKSKIEKTEEPNFKFNKTEIEECEKKVDNITKKVDDEYKNLSLDENIFKDLNTNYENWEHKCEDIYNSFNTKDKRKKLMKSLSFMYDDIVDGKKLGTVPKENFNKMWVYLQTLMEFLKNELFGEAYGILSEVVKNKREVLKDRFSNDLSFGTDKNFNSAYIEPEFFRGRNKLMDSDTKK
ncbi:MAG: hypothetical protein GY830_03080 [Bacteroidetes bacterium]|nr:hypothetical protein [Bacteroidota bacterium]